MKKVFLLICVLIVYGSLYPFDFRNMGPGDWDHLLASWHGRTFRSDILSNIVLFVPLGYFGVLAWGRRWWLVTLALGLGVVLQLLQLFLPSRDANLLDVIWNLLGAGLGAALTALPLARWSLRGGRLHKEEAFVLLLLGAWVAYRLLPFVPSLDWQEIKDSLKPLLLHPRLDYLDLLRNTISWATVAALWPTLWHGRYPWRWLLALGGGVFFLEVLIVDNVLSLANVLGLVLGLMLWRSLQPLPQATMTMTALLAVALLVEGLWPFELAARPGQFHWLPFYGFLGGSMLINIAALLEKIFLYGALLWLGYLAMGTLRPIVLVLVVLTGGVEFAQIFIAGHTAEITDPLLVLCLALVLKVSVSQGDDAMPAAIKTDR